MKSVCVSKQRIFFSSLLLASALLFSSLAFGEKCIWSVSRSFIDLDRADDAPVICRSLQGTDLAVEPAGINRLYNLNSEAVGHVLVRNVGKLPARNVQVVVNLRWDQNKAFAPNTFPADVIEDRAIQPGASMRQGAPDYIPILTARQPDNYIFVWGIVRYDDGYGYRRFTKFCHRYSGASHFRGVSPLPTEYLAVIIEAEKARYHPAGNDSD